MSSVPTIILQYIQHPRHLCEDENSAPLLHQLGQQPVQDQQLGGVLDQMLVCSVWRPGLSTVKQIRVITAFTQLHQNILKTHLFGLSGAVHDIDILHQDLGVPVPLHLRQPNEDLNFLLWKKRLLHVTLKTTK